MARPMANDPPFATLDHVTGDLGIPSESDFPRVGITRWVWTEPGPFYCEIERPRSMRRYQFRLLASISSRRGASADPHCFAFSYHSRAIAMFGAKPCTASFSSTMGS